MRISPATVTKGLAEISFNLASGWFGVLLISPGYFGVTLDEFGDLLLRNLFPAIIIFIIGLFLTEKVKNYG
ncbi:hypothetical protein A3I57_00500 [Candidatus Beckwithbacteria bacterium RIFCSPLOWO2_02_FULL_47_23]|uniref:Uncharacterized protein n=2 Tax=Candidatus Beckwithiibacteriota TaxID=1752726 RepID=A0A1F5DSJ5_9BACT|nr:MAG: hypothetical protein A3E73_00460 [Candidatus Beckwithbacteria bacterium RIFCSPHIGHO2_12_FULL_47_17]OGD57991.1 MAG: hypothetical protein A3I57_00500 [Candidatus Beckwithbacteria bacterium RIFCSPLOWO2_02_FULL_47_23]